MDSYSLLLAVPFLVVVGLLLPILALKSNQQTSSETVADENLPSTLSFAVQAIVVHIVVFGLGWLAVFGSGIQVSWRADLALIPLAVTVAIVALGMVVAWVDSRRPTDGSNAVGRVLERAPSFDPPILAMVIAAGFAEEFAYRGVLTGLLAGPLRMVPAAVVSALLFAIAHFAQGWRGFFGSAAFALALQGVVHLSGGLALAIAAHIAYDLGAIWLSQLMARRRNRIVVAPTP